LFSGKVNKTIMLRNTFIVTALLLSTYSIGYGVSDVDIQVCEARASDDQKIECYRDLMLNPSCHILKRDQLACFRRSGKRILSPRNDNSLPQQKKSANPSDDFFEQPQRLCSALSHIGLYATGWEANVSNSENEWRCQSAYASFGSPGGNNLKNDIAYYIYGAMPDRASDIRIVVNINNPSEQKQALGRLEAATRVLFKEISEHLPLELILALRHKTPLSMRTDFGTVDLIRTSGQIESYQIALTDTKIVSSQDQLRTRARGDFESCKMTTARAVGYSAYEIFGTGVPEQGLGHTSYRLRGRGMDWFICKVFPGGKYRVEAAINGKYPLELIAEGAF
jgi:hypothetical protein